MKRPGITLNKILFAIFFLLITSTFMSCATSKHRTYRNRHVPSTKRNGCGCYIINEQNENLQQITLHNENTKGIETTLIAKQ